jgi:hypothetical protein
VNLKRSILIGPINLVITMSYFNSTTTMLLRCRPPLQRTISSTRSFHISPYHLQRDLFDPNSVERVADDVDVCIVGGGPAGLSAAIRLKQLEKEKGKEMRVVVLEKGAEVGESCYFILSSERCAGLFVEGLSWLHNRVFCRDLGALGNILAKSETTSRSGHCVQFCSSSLLAD